MPRRTWLRVACGAGVVENARWARERSGDWNLEAMGDIDVERRVVDVRDWRAAGEKKLRRSAEAMMGCAIGGFCLLLKATFP